MTARPSLFAHREEPVHRARHRATEKQQVPLGVHSHDAEPQLGEVARPHVPGHALTLDDARRIGARRDRAGLPMPRIAVGFGAAAEVIPVHHALEPAALGHARDLDAVAGGEDRHGHGFAGLWCLSRDGETLQHARRGLQAGLLHVTRQGLRGPRRLLRPEAELDLRLAHLYHRARTRLDDRYGHVRAFRVEHAGHAEFSADQSGHYSRPLSVIRCPLLHFDFDIDARGEIELGQGIDGLGPRIQDIDQPLVRLELELLTALLVDVRAPEHRPQLPVVVQRNGPRDLRAGLFRGAHDVGQGLIDLGAVERFETDTDPASHRDIATARSWWSAR